MRHRNRPPSQRWSCQTYRYVDRRNPFPRSQISPCIPPSVENLLPTRAGAEGPSRCIALCPPVGSPGSVWTHSKATNQIPRVSSNLAGSSSPRSNTPAQFLPGPSSENSQSSSPAPRSRRALTHRLALRCVGHVGNDKGGRSCTRAP